MKDMQKYSEESYRKAYLASPISEFLSTIVIMVLMYVGGNLVLHGSGNMTPARSDSLSGCLFTDHSACKKYYDSIFCHSERNGIN